MATDYGNQIQGDPNYIALRNLIQAQSAAEAAQRAAAAQQAIIGFGEVPTLPGGINTSWFNQDITNTTRDLAGQNTAAGLSTLARLMHGFQIAQRGALNQLADRGMLQSGETGYQLGELGLGYKQQQYDARTDLLSRLMGLYSTAAQNEQQRQMQLAQLAIQVGQDRAGNPAYYGDGEDRGGGGQGSSGGGTTGGGTSGGGGTGGGSSPGYPVPSAAEIAMMDRYDGISASKRPAAVQALYQQYAQWRTDPNNAGWNNPSPGGWYDDQGQWHTGTPPPRG